VWSGVEWSGVERGCNKVRGNGSTVTLFDRRNIVRCCQGMSISKFICTAKVCEALDLPSLRVNSCLHDPNE